MPMIQQRKLIEVNTDPQRRCYYGCHASSELLWTAWEDLDEATEDKIQAKLEFWKELNDYAVSQRGEVNTKKQFRIVK